MIGLFLFGGSLAGQATNTASEEVAALRDKIRAAHASGDAAAYVATSRRLEEFLHDSPQSLLQLMSAQTFAGDEDGALQSLERFIRMGQAEESTLAAKPFDALRKSSKFLALHTEMAKNNEAIARATEVFRMEETDLIPEDVDYDPRTARFFVTSVLQKEILTFDEKGHSQVFARAPDAWPMMALKIDSGRRLLWATEVSLKGFKWSPEAAWGRSAVLIYNLDSGKLLHRLEELPKAAFGDMTLTRDGDAIVSDNDGGGVYRVSRRTLKVERLDGGEFVSPQTATISADNRRLFVPDYSRGIGVLDLVTKKVAWLGSAGQHAVSGIDGVYLDGTTLLATQNGTTPERVISFGLDGSLTNVVSESIIERATASLGDPTHGVVVGRVFYYIANSGWDAVGDDGGIKEGNSMTHPRLMRINLSDVMN
jgi:sugar lactone lactonase YvrE